MFVRSGPSGPTKIAGARTAAKFARRASPADPFQGHIVANDRYPQAAFRYPEDAAKQVEVVAVKGTHVERVKRDLDEVEFVPDVATIEQKEREPKRRRTTGVVDSRNVVEVPKHLEAPSLSAVHAQGQMAAWAAGDIGSGPKDDSYKAPSSAFRGLSAPAMPLSVPHKQPAVLIERGEFSVRAPTFAELGRLRELEREFVMEHALLCREYPW